MGKKDKAEKAKDPGKRIAKLQAIIDDKDRYSKPERKAAKAELQSIVDSVEAQYMRETAEADAIVAEKMRETAEAYSKAAAFTPDEIDAAAERVLADGNASDGAKESARAAKMRAAAARNAKPETDGDEPPAPSEGDLAARVHAKRALRKAGLLTEGDGGALVVDPEAVPRGDAALVEAYNLVIGTTTGRYLTSDDEREAIAERIAPKPRKAKADELVVEIGGETVAAPQPDPVAIADGIEAAARKGKAPKALKLAKPSDADGPDPLATGPGDAIPAPEPVTIAEHEVVEVETETGREFAVGEKVAARNAPDGLPVDAGFVKPSDAPVQLETDGLGRYKIMNPETGKLGGYTRVTTYIDNLEDKSALTKWKLRIALEGLALNEVEAGTARDHGETLPPHLLAEVRDAMHARDVAIAKARKAERKGKLKTGELGEIIDDAMRDYKRAADAIVETALAIGGVKDAAQKGTDLHALTELHDREGLDAVVALLDAGEITRADFDDVEAYARALRVAGVKVLPELIEQVVVDDERKVAGRLDRVVMYRFPGTQRAVRCVLDVKTGRLDFGTGKIAQQLELYSGGKAYDLDTHERTDLKLSRTKALVLHLPPGKAVATLHEVDLVAGRRGNALSGQVRQWRNEGKRAIDLKVDLAAAAPEAAL